LAAKDVQLMTESEVLQFKNGPTAEPAGNRGDDGMHMLKHCRRHYVDPSQNSRLFAAFGVVSSDTYQRLGTYTFSKAISTTGTMIEL
jgi:hypothetical protein